MQLQLLIVGGKASKADVTLKLPAVIGRGREADLTIGHPTISRQHCRVFETDGLVMVRDLDSLNGTVVNGERVREAALPPDGEFTIGPLSFQAKYQYDGDLGELPAPKLADKKKSRRPIKKAEGEEDLIGANARTEAVPSGSQGGSVSVAAGGDQDEMMIDFEEVVDDEPAAEAPTEASQPEAASAPHSSADALDDDIFKDFLEGSQ